MYIANATPHYIHKRVFFMATKVNIAISAEKGRTLCRLPYGWKYIPAYIRKAAITVFLLSEGDGQSARIVLFASGA